jgi:hypothetical protein
MLPCIQIAVPSNEPGSRACQSRGMGLLLTKLTLFWFGLSFHLYDDGCIFSRDMIGAFACIEKDRPFFL